MKHADLKRLPVGTRLTLVNCLMGPCNKPRTLKKITSNALLFEPDDKPGTISWLYFGKAKDFRAEENGFSIIDIDGNIAASYRFIYD